MLNLHLLDDGVRQKLLPQLYRKTAPLHYRSEDAGLDHGLYTDVLIVHKDIEVVGRLPASEGLEANGVGSALVWSCPWASHFPRLNDLGGPSAWAVYESSPSTRTQALHWLSSSSALLL